MSDDAGIALPEGPTLILGWSVGVAWTCDPEIDADALVVRATVLTYRWIDELQAAALSSEITDVAVASQWHSLLALDARDRPVSPALTWADARRARTADISGDPAAFHRRASGGRACLHQFQNAARPTIAASNSTTMMTMRCSRSVKSFTRFTGSDTSTSGERATRRFPATPQIAT